LTATASGCELTVLARDPLGNLGKPPAKFAQTIENPIREAMRRAAQQYFAFKAIFGEWADGAMLVGATVRGLQLRLESLGGTLKDKSGDFSQALMPRQALKL
jgi:hypothetical protein